MKAQLNQPKISPYIIPGIGIASETIMSDVKDFFNVTAEQLTSKCRRRELVLPRQVAMYLHNQYTKLGHKRIASILNRDRTTVIYSVDMIHDFLHSKGETYEKRKLNNFMRLYGYTVKPRISHSHVNVEVI